MKNWKYIEGAKTGNAFDFETRMVVEKKEELKTAEDELRKAEADRNRHKGERYWEEAYITAKKDVERAKENLARAQRNKTGNETLGQFITQKPKAVNEDKTGAEEFFKQLSDDVKEREEKDDKEIKLVGNETYQHKLYPDKYVIIEGNNYKIVTDGKVEKSGKITDAVLYGINQTYKKVGNARYTTREDVISHLDTDLYDICKKVPAGSPSFAYVSELQKKGWDISTISKYTKEIGKIIDQYKVGNSKVKKTLFKSLATPTTWTPGINGRPISGAPEFKGTFAKDEAEKWTDKWIKDHGFEVENKTGNATPNYRYKDFLITNPEGHEYIVFLKDGRTVGYRGTTSKAQAEDWCDWHDPKTGKSIGNKVGNSTVSEYNAEIQRLTKKAEQIGNSASDDKFAYVMREFDEGKLKTPDGKVVTDPAQAKAIAYSESKKTENGLARARNAMNKKCGNAQITLWKGNDTVLISENGLVQYLESNSFEVDRDKYDSQEQAIEELTKKGYRKK